MPAVEMCRMLGSGTEGFMAAIRAAQAFTKKKYAIKVGGAYHGWSDQMVYGLHIPGIGRLVATGIPRGASRSQKTDRHFERNTSLRRVLLNKNPDN